MNVKELMEKAGLGNEQAARLCGVTVRTISYWRSGRTAPSKKALAILECAADRRLFEKRPMNLDDQISVLRHIQQQQTERCRRLEDELAEERLALNETVSKLNALYAARGKQENAE